MTIKNVCFLNAFLFYGLEVNNHADRYLVRTIPLVLDVLQFFVHPLLFVVFCVRVKLNRKVAAQFGQEKAEKPFE